MPDKDPSQGGDTATATAPAKPKRSAKPVPKKRPPELLPPWKVLLHNDDKNDMNFVVLTVM
jgi:ATP-dependent Clp protease adapter protein ClpS